MNAAGLLFALGALVALGGPRTSISSDEGAGIRQAVLLQRGSWLVAPTLPELDPQLVQQPFLRADAGPKGRAPYAKHPAYPLVLELASRGWWPHGLMLPGVLGTWVAAVAAALLAGALRRSAQLPTLWLVGLGSPLTVDAQMVLAHAPAAGTSAVAALSAAVVLAPGAFGPRASRPWVTALAGAAAVTASAATVVLRGEGILLVGGLVLGALCAGSPWRRSVPLAAALATGAIVSRAVETMAVRSIVGRASAAPSAPMSQTGLLAGRIQAFQASWLEGGYSGRIGEALLVGGVGALGLAFLGARWRVRAPIVVALTTAAVGGALAWVLLGDVGLVPGLLPAAPWLVAGLASMKGSVLRAGLPRFLAVASAAAASAILATQYSFGGGVEWGGRFYAIVLPLAAPLAITALWPTSSRWWRQRTAPIVVAVLAVTGLVSLGGLLAVRSNHQVTAEAARHLLSAARAAPPGRPDDTDTRPVVLGPQRLWPQLFWPVFDDYRWVTTDDARLPCALYGLQAAGFRRLVLMGPSPDDLVTLAEAQGWNLAQASPGGFRVVEADLSRPAAAPACPAGEGG